MARLIPKISVEDISVKPERDVARALVSQLEQDCIIYHSYPWLRVERNDVKRNIMLNEGETDFVVVDPTYGILIIEVKGGNVDYDAQVHKWYRLLNNGNNKEIKDPFSQARKGMHFLKDQILKYTFPGESQLPCAFGYAVVFPDCEYNGAAPPGSDKCIILSASDMPFLSKRLRAVLNKWNRLPKPRRLNKEQLDGILKGLSPSF